MALSEADDEVAKIKERILKLDGNRPLQQITERKREVALLTAQELLTRAADSIARGHIPNHVFATRLLEAAESLGTIL